MQGDLFNGTVKELGHGTISNVLGRTFEERVATCWRSNLPTVHVYPQWPFEDRWGGKRKVDLMISFKGLRIFNSCKYVNSGTHLTLMHDDIDVLSDIVSRFKGSAAFFVTNFNGVNEEPIITHCLESRISYVRFDDLPHYINCLSRLTNDPD